MPPAPRARAAKTALGRDAVVAAALAVVDEVGYAGASMRRVARALETGPASLYVYVADRHELMALAYDRALAEVVLPGEADGDWRARLELLVDRMVTALGRHDDLASVALTDVPTGPHALRGYEEMLRLLSEGGVADAQLPWASDLLGQYVSSAALELAGWIRWQRSIPDPQRATPEAMTAAFTGRLDAVFAGLDPQRYPVLHRLRADLTGGSGPDRTAWKLRVLVDGLLAQPGGTAVS